MASATQLLEVGPAARRAGTVTARKPRSEVDLERGLATSYEQLYTVDGRPALVRLTSSGLEWSATARAQPATHLPFCEVLSAWQLEPGVGEGKRRLHRLAVYSFARAPRRRSEWHPRRLVLASPDQHAVRQLCEDIRAGVGLSPRAQQRPQRILLLLNPASGDQRAPGLYRCIVGPVFAAAGLKVDLRETAHPGHAREIVRGLTEAEMQAIDGIVAMGGDGAFHEILNGVLAARASAPPALAAALGALRLGHIPAGSTDAVACSLNGSRSAFTAAMHIALGDDSALDVLAVHALRQGGEAPPPTFASCIAAAGFMGEVMVQSESLRWLGPLRYDLTGFKVLLQNRPFAAKISWTTGPAARRLGPQHNASVCHTDCGVCEEASLGEAAAAAARGGDSAAEPPASTEDGEWSFSEGEFLSIMVIISPCRSDKTQSGMARFGHLADGRAKLVLVRRCGRLAYLRFLLQMAAAGVYPGCCPHVEVRDATAVRVELGGSATAAWNLDGEMLAARAISAEVLPTRVRVFARGVER